MLFAIGSLATTGHGSSAHKHAKETGESDGHMMHMNEIRKWLKQELGDTYNKLVPSATAEQLALGKKIYAKTCASCHGESGKGDGPVSSALKQKPAAFSDLAHSKFYSDQGRVYIIKKGIKDTLMPGWESTLSEKEIQVVYAYIRSLRSSESEVKKGHRGHDH